MSKEVSEEEENKTEPSPCSECRIDQEETGIHHTVCEGFPNCVISVCDSCKTKLIMQGKWFVCEPHEEWPHFDKCKECYEEENKPHKEE